jgi:hypothetical protein
LGIAVRASSTSDWLGAAAKIIRTVGFTLATCRILDAMALAAAEAIAVLLGNTKASPSPNVIRLTTSTNLVLLIESTIGNPTPSEIVTCNRLQVN